MTMMLWTLLLLGVTVNAQFDGLGEYLCGYYDGNEDICPDPAAAPEYGPICMSVCRTCDDDTVDNYVKEITADNPKPATDSIAGAGIQSYLNGIADREKCDSAAGYTTIFNEQFQYPGQLHSVEFFVDSTCVLNSQKGLRIGIFREAGTGAACSYTLVAMQNIPKTTIISLLGGRTSGLIQYSLDASVRSKLTFQAGDRFGFRPTGSGLVSYDKNLGGSSQLCMENVGAWTIGNDYTVTTPATRALRQYSINLVWMPY